MARQPVLLGSRSGWARPPWATPLAIIGVGAAFSVVAVLAGQGRLLAGGARLMPPVSASIEQAVLIALFALGVLFCHGSAYVVFTLSDHALLGGVGTRALWLRRLLASVGTASTVGALFIQLFVGVENLQDRFAYATHGIAYATAPLVAMALAFVVLERRRPTPPASSAPQPYVPPQSTWTPPDVSQW
ncbi:MAG: hypothetical protein HYV63_02620 [Candidatus Schekmanbacteria bacterium]|nr:hypothetical protein [Candidatus Schekmanbacteria bacterium]